MNDNITTIEEVISLNSAKTVYFDLPNEGGTPTLEIYRLSDGYTWNFSSTEFTLAATTGNLTLVSDDVYKQSFTPSSTEDTYIATATMTNGQKKIQIFFATDENKSLIVNQAKNFVFDLPNATSGGTQTVSIYQVSTTKTWDFSASQFASGSNTGSMTFIKDNLWKQSFTPDIEDQYIITVIADTGITYKRVLVSEVAVSTDLSSAHKTVQDIYDLIKYPLLDFGQTGYKIEEVIQYINEAVREVFEKINIINPSYYLNTEHWQEKQHTLMADQKYYSVPALTGHIIYPMYIGSVPVHPGGPEHEYMRSGETQAIMLNPISSRNMTAVLVNINGNRYVQLMPTPGANGDTNAFKVKVAVMPSTIDAVQASSTEKVPFSIDFCENIKMFVISRCKGRSYHDLRIDAAFQSQFEGLMQVKIGRTNSRVYRQNKSRWSGFKN